MNESKFKLSNTMSGITFTIMPHAKIYMRKNKIEKLFQKVRSSLLRVVEKKGRKSECEMTSGPLLTWTVALGFLSGFCGISALLRRSSEPV